MGVQEFKIPLIDLFSDDFIKHVKEGKSGEAKASEMENWDALYQELIKLRWQA